MDAAFAVPREHPLDDVRAFLARFVAFPSDWALNAVTLWAAHAHAVDAFDSTPRLALLSPEPGSGKSRTLEVLELLVPRPLYTLNCTPAALFRKIADPEGAPTVLLDEADTIFGPKASKEHEDLRGMVNAGHRRGAMAVRAAPRGREIVVEEFPSFAAVALAGLDDLPDTIMTRSVVIRMRRRAPDEQVEPFRHRVHAPAGHELRERLADFMRQVEPELRDAWPEMPDGVVDRAADVWEPLVAIADAAGGWWPEAIRRDAIAAVGEAKGKGETLGIRLLADLRSAYVDRSAKHLFTSQILEHLTALEDAPWGDLRGKPLDARGLSRRLSRYGLKPRTVRIGSETGKGYALDDLADTFGRYLPRDGVTDVTAPMAERETTASTDVTKVTSTEGGGFSPSSNEEPLSLRPKEAVTSVTPSQSSSCAVCGTELDPVLIFLGDSAHPGCELEQVAS